jgi:hypothetical protein
MLSISDAPFDFVPALTILGPDDVPESIQIVTVADGTSERLYASRIMQTMARVMLKGCETRFLFPYRKLHTLRR